MKEYIFFILCFINVLFGKPYAYFLEPEKFELVNPKAYSKFIEIGFIKKSSVQFSPSINLATEQTSYDLETYIEASKIAINKDKNSSFVPLDYFQTPHYKVFLAKIDKNTNFGKIIVLQMLYVENKIGYVISLAFKTEDFNVYYPIFKNLINTFYITDNLFYLIKDKTIKKNLITNYDQMISTAKPLIRSQKIELLKTFEKKNNKDMLKISKHFKYLLLKKASKDLEIL